MSQTLVSFDTIKLSDGVFRIDINTPAFDFKSSTPVLVNCLELLNQQEAKKVILNLSNVSHLTTSGIGTILSIYHCAIHNNAEVVLFNLKPDINEILTTTMVDTVIRIENNEATL